MERVRTRRGEVGEPGALLDSADEVESDRSLRNPVLMPLMVLVVLLLPESAMAAACSGVGRSSVRMMF